VDRVDQGEPDQESVLMPAKKKRKRGTAAGDRKKPKRQAMPGGAPVAAPRKKKSTSSSSKKAPKEKPPCKYGPRDADGYCPKKPAAGSTTRRRKKTTVSARTTDSAVRQAAEVISNPNATTSQKTAAIGKVAEVTITEAAKKTIKRNATPEKIAKAKQAIKDALPAAIELAGSAVATAGAGELYKRTRKAVFQSPKLKAEHELRMTETRLKRKLTATEREVLRRQYIEFFTANPNAPTT
jgi:hypothetical protein